MIRLYKGVGAPALFSAISGVRWTDLLWEYSTKERLIAPTFFVCKVPFEVPHDCGTALFNVGMYFWDPFLMKRMSPLDPVSSNTLIVSSLTISLLLALLEGLLRPQWCFENLYGFFFFKFSPVLGFFSNFPIKTLRIATTAVTLPVLAFSVAIWLALEICNASLVALIGRV